MSDLLDLLIPHPAEALYHKGSDVLHELLAEGMGTVSDNSDDDLPPKYLIPLIPVQLEIVGSHSTKTLSLHLLDKPYNGNLRQLEKVLGLAARNNDEKLQKLLSLNDVMSEFKFDLPIPPETLVYEFATSNGCIQSISCYDGQFTDVGWRWEVGRRKFRKEGYDLGGEFALAQRGYNAMRRVRDVLEENCTDRDLPLSQRDVYDHYLKALIQIVDKEAMKRFVESVSGQSVSKK